MGTSEMTDLARSLLDPAAYPDDRPDRVELVETHVSWLFFAGRHGYKVKKPVDYGFLDFTTPAKRRFYCEEETRLNRRLSPDVYLGVSPIGFRDGRYVVGALPPVEWAVKMRRIPADRWLSRVLDRGEATPELMRRIARRVAEFHRGAATDDHIRQMGGIAAVRFNTAENFAQTRDQIGVTVPLETYDRIKAYTEAFIAARADLFARRELEGRIRDGHGDLHADQIAVENGIEFIDCIEFNERFRFGDVAADIAFTAMDVDYHGHPELATDLVAEYVLAAGDPGVLELLDFYRCYRAFTRGKVRGFRLRQRLGPTEREAVIGQSARYFELAGRYAALRGPRLLVITGLMGSGKTSLATGLAARLEADVLSSDVVRKEMAGIAPAEPRREPWGEGIYRERVTGQTYAELHRRAAERLDRGRVVVLDASYRSPDQRAAAAATARAASAPFLLLELECPEPVLRERLAARVSGPSDGRLELLARQIAEYRPADEIPVEARLEVDGAPPADAVVAAALRAVYERSAAIERPVHPDFTVP